MIKAGDILKFEENQSQDQTGGSIKTIKSNKTRTKGSFWNQAPDNTVCEPQGLESMATLYCVFVNPGDLLGIFSPPWIQLLHKCLTCKRAIGNISKLFSLTNEVLMFK